MLRDTPGWSRWLLREPGPNSRALLYVLPHPGCGGETYRRWPHSIGQWEVCPVQLRRDEVYGRGTREMSYRMLAERLINALDVCPGRSIGFFGHRGMALLGLEAAARVAAIGAGGESLRLFVSGQPPPGTASSAHLGNSSDSTLAEDMFRAVLEMGGNPLPSLIERQLRVLQADLTAAAEYRVVDPVPDQLRVTTFSWAQDEALPLGAMEGWRKFGRVAGHVLPGDQYRFLSAPAELRKVLDAESRTLE